MILIEDEINDIDGQTVTIRNIDASSVSNLITEYKCPRSGSYCIVFEQEGERKINLTI